jgi:hypothetical protein
MCALDAMYVPGKLDSRISASIPGSSQAHTMVDVRLLRTKVRTPHTPLPLKLTRTRLQAFDGPPSATKVHSSASTVLSGSVETVEANVAPAVRPHGALALRSAALHSCYNEAGRQCQGNG